MFARILRALDGTPLGWEEVGIEPPLSGTITKLEDGTYHVAPPEGTTWDCCPRRVKVMVDIALTREGLIGGRTDGPVP
jgi:hypothetical protein